MHVYIFFCLNMYFFNVYLTKEYFDLCIAVESVIDSVNIYGSGTMNGFSDLHGDAEIVTSHVPRESGLCQALRLALA